MLKGSCQRSWILVFMERHVLIVIAVAALVAATAGCGGSGGGSGNGCKDGDVNINGLLFDDASPTIMDLEHNCDTGEVEGTLQFAGRTYELSGEVVETMFTWTTEVIDFCDTLGESRQLGTVPDVASEILAQGESIVGSYQLIQFPCSNMLGSRREVGDRFTR